MSGTSSTYRAAVLEHFRKPRNRGALATANREADGANPLCGDRIRVQLRVDGDHIADAAFTADACALCIASASVLTEAVRGMRAGDAFLLDGAWIANRLGGDPPAARQACAVLPITTLRRALGNG